ELAVAIADRGEAARALFGRRDARERELVRDLRERIAGAELGAQLERRAVIGLEHERDVDVARRGFAIVELAGAAPEVVVQLDGRARRQQILVDEDRLDRAARLLP